LYKRKYSLELNNKKKIYIVQYCTRKRIIKKERELSLKREREPQKTNVLLKLATSKA